MKFRNLLLAFCLAALCAPAQISFTLSSNTQFSIICTPSVSMIFAASNYSAPVTYTWSGPSITVSPTNSIANVSAPGSYTVIASSGTVSTSQVFSIGVNTLFPTFVASPTLVSVGFPGSPSFTFSLISPTVNVTHYFYTPGTPAPTVSGGTISVNVPDVPGTYTHCVMYNVNGCTTCTLVTVNISGTSIRENSQDEQPGLVFPNPNKGLFYIQAKPDFTQVEIYNALGALVLRQSLMGIGTGMDLRPQPAGIYWVKLSGDTRTHTLKIIVM